MHLEGFDASAVKHTNDANCVRRIGIIGRALNRLSQKDGCDNPEQREDDHRHVQPEN